MREKVFNFLHFLGVPTILRLGKNNTITILSLHRVSTDRDYFFDPINPKLFNELLVYLKKYYEIITFKDISEVMKFNKKPLLILSFDDGYYDFYEYALPILQKHKISANHNIVNECASFNKIIWTQRLNFLFNQSMKNKIDLEFEIDDIKYNLSYFNYNWLKFNLTIFKMLLSFDKFKRENIIGTLENNLSIKASDRMMNWEEVKECSNNNIEIGSHTFSHDVVSTIKNNEELLKEIKISKIEIEQRINKPIQVLALPNGQGDSTLDKIVEEAGYDFLLYVNDKINPIISFSNKDLKKVDRLNLINESLSESILRIEMFHQKIRK